MRGLMPELMIELTQGLKFGRRFSQWRGCE